jgi:hypothetical protein
MPRLSYCEAAILRVITGLVKRQVDSGQAQSSITCGFAFGLLALA